MEWSKLYHKMLNDPALLSLSPADRWHYVALYCLASQSKPRGSLPHSAVLAKMLHANRKVADKSVARLVAAGLVDRDPETLTLSIRLVEPASSTRRPGTSHAANSAG